MVDSIDMNDKGMDAVDSVESVSPNNTEEQRKKLDTLTEHSLFSGESEIPDIQQYLDCDDPLVRFYANKAIGVIRQREGRAIERNALPLNIADFTSSDDRFRMDAIKKVVHGKYGDYLLFLMDLALNEKDEYTKGALIIAVGSIGSNAESEFIADFLPDPSPNVRLSALTALSINNSPDLALFAAPLAEDSEKDISDLAMKILQNSSEPKRQEAVMAILESGEDKSALVLKIITTIQFSREFLIQLLKMDRLSTEAAEKVAIFMLSRYETSPDMSKQIKSVIESRKHRTGSGQTGKNLTSAVTRILEESELDNSTDLNDEEKILSGFSPDDPDIKKGREYLLKRMADMGIIRLKSIELETDDELHKYSELYRGTARKLDEKNDELTRAENKQVESKGGFFQQAFGSLGKLGNVAKLKLELSQIQLDMDTIKIRLGERIHHLCLIGKIAEEDLVQISGKCQYAAIAAKKEREQATVSRKEKETANIEAGRAYFEKAGDMLSSFTSKAVNFTRNQSLIAQIEGEKAAKLSSLSGSKKRYSRLFDRS
jgi:hypothetical protein